MKLVAVEEGWKVSYLGRVKYYFGVTRKEARQMMHADCGEADLSNLLH